MKLIVTKVVILSDSTVETNTYGPYVDHQSANAAMQQMFDMSVEQLEEQDTVFNKDDSDAGHFYIDADVGEHHFTISELEKFNA